MPAYMEIKKLLPSGSRNALSALLAYDTGKLDDTLAKSHELFGWHLTDRESTTVLANLQILRQLVNPRAIERGGSSPSCKKGRELLKREHRAKQIRTSRYELQQRMRIRFDEQLRQATSGAVSDSSPLLVRLAVYHCWEYSRNLRLVNAIMGINRQTGRGGSNRVPTLFTDTPARLGETDCYAVSCLYSERNKTRKGVCLLRATWQDVKHVSAEDWEAAKNLQLPSIDQFWVDQIHQASNWALERQRRQRQTEQEYLASQSDRIYGLLRTLHNLPQICLEDSYRTGNCQAGTFQFCQALGLDPEQRKCCGGWELAKKWVAAEFVSIDRLEPAVIVAKHRLATLEASAAAAGQN
jgi:hypothetical protein